MRHLIIILSIIIAFYSTKGVAMSMLFGKEVVLSSPLEGTITLNGKPAAKAEIIRILKWKDDIGETETYLTNEQGHFSLPLKQAKVRIPALAEFVISQTILVRHAGQEIQIWGRTKRGIEIYDELGGRPVNFRCELTDEIEFLDVSDGLFGTSCKWDSLEN